jgi:hypothetical protein
MFLVFPAKAGIYFAHVYRSEPVLGPRRSVDPWAGVTMKVGHCETGRSARPMLPKS